MNEQTDRYLTWFSELMMEPWYEQMIDSDETCMLSIDPGDVHCGTAFWAGDLCVHTVEFTQAECLFAVRGCLEAGVIDELVYEAFVLYPWKSDQQAFSQLSTSQMIGGIKATWGWYSLGTTIHEQPASIKKPTFAIAKARKYKSTARRQRTGTHCQDAEAHGYFRINNREKD